MPRLPLLPLPLLLPLLRPSPALCQSTTSPLSFAETQKDALAEDLCTDELKCPGGRYVSFNLTTAEQDPGALRRREATERKLLSDKVPAKLHEPVKDDFDELQTWLQTIDLKQVDLGYSATAKDAMDSALRSDPLSLFEVEAPKDLSGLPKEVDMYLRYAPGHKDEVRDVYDASSPYLQQAQRRRLVADIFGEGVQTDLSAIKSFFSRNRRRASIFPNGQPYGANDDRTEVLYPNNLYFGWSTLVSTGNRASRWCSGTMISPRVILTAAHCVATIGTMGNPGGVNWLSQPQICLRDIQRQTPTAASPTYAGCTDNDGILATWTRMTTFVKWARDADRDWDIGWIELDSPVGLISGWKGIRTRSAGFPAGTTINVAGYGGDCPSGGDCNDNLKTMSCKIEEDFECIAASSRPNRYYYECDTIGGMSGSGAYLYFPDREAPDNRFVIGVHAYGIGDCTSHNRAIVIRPSILQAICANTPDVICGDFSTPGALGSSCR